MSSRSHHQHTPVKVLPCPKRRSSCIETQVYQGQPNSSCGFLRCLKIGIHLVVVACQHLLLANRVSIATWQPRLLVDTGELLHYRRILGRFQPVRAAPVVPSNQQGSRESNRSSIHAFFFTMLYTSTVTCSHAEHGIGLLTPSPPPPPPSSSAPSSPSGSDSSPPCTLGTSLRCRVRRW